MFLFDTDTGALAAILEVMYLSWLKTAAVSALATRYLAPPDSAVLALFGTGRHARSQLYGLTRVADIQRVQAYSRNPAKRQAFCERMSAELDIEVIAAASPEAALRDADIVTAITTSPTPVFPGAALPDKPLHINGLGAHYPWVREIDTQTVVKSRVFVDVLQQGLKENGELVIPIEEGRIDSLACQSAISARWRRAPCPAVPPGPAGRFSFPAAQAWMMLPWRRAYTRGRASAASVPSLNSVNPTSLSFRRQRSWFLFLRNHEIRGLMDLPEYIAAVEAGYREIGTGAGAAFPRENLWIRGDKDVKAKAAAICPAGSKASFKFKAALLPGMGGAGMQAYTAGLAIRARDLPVPLRHEHGRAGRGHGGALLRLAEDGSGICALAARYLAPENSRNPGPVRHGPTCPFAAARLDRSACRLSACKPTAATTRIAAPFAGKCPPS